MGLISKYEAGKRRKAYRDAHRFSWAPLLDGKWRLSLKGPVIVHHIAGGRGRDAYEQPSNYFPIADFPVANEHLAWAHGRDIKAVKPFWDYDSGYDGQAALRGHFQAEARLQCWALKFLAGETPIEAAEKLMKGRGLTWWSIKMGMETTFEDVITSVAATFAMNIKKFPC